MTSKWKQQIIQFFKCCLRCCACRYCCQCLPKILSIPSIKRNKSALLLVGSDYFSLFKLHRNRWTVPSGKKNFCWRLALHAAKCMASGCSRAIQIACKITCIGKILTINACGHVWTCTFGEPLARYASHTCKTEYIQTTIKMIIHSVVSLNNTIKPLQSHRHTFNRAPYVNIEETLPQHD